MSDLIKYCVLIVCGVTFLLWMSTFGDNTIREKMEFYGSVSGQFVAMILLMIPFFLVFKSVMESQLSKAQLVKRMSAMVAAQVVLAAFIPLIVNVYTDAGKEVAGIVIDAKKI